MRERIRLIELRLNAVQTKGRLLQLGLVAYWIVVLQHVIGREFAVCPQQRRVSGNHHDAALLPHVVVIQRGDGLAKRRLMFLCTAALHRNALLAHHDAGHVVVVQPPQQPFREAALVGDIVVHHVAGSHTAVGVGGIGIAVIISQAERMTGFVDDCLSAVNGVRWCMQKRHVAHFLAVVYPALVGIELMAPPLAAPAGVRPREMQVHHIDASVVVPVELVEVNGGVKRLHRFVQQLLLGGVFAAVAGGVVVERLAGEAELAVRGTLIVGIQALIGVELLIRAVDQRLQCLKRIVLREAHIRKVDAERDHPGLAGAPQTEALPHANRFRGFFIGVARAERGVDRRVGVLGRIRLAGLLRSGLRGLLRCALYLRRILRLRRRTL